MRIQPRPYPASRLLLGVFVLSVASMYSYNVQAAGTQPPIPRGVTMKSWHENGSGGRYVLHVVEGQPLKSGKAVTGTVLTDTDCDADAEGLSHCHNTIELANGARIAVIDTHEMQVNRCMSPGEQISLTGIGKSWIVGTVSTK